MFDWTLVGDPHVTHKSLDRAAQLFQIVEEMGRPTIWTGDLLDNKEIIRGKCLNAFFEYFSKSKLFHVILVGNHDWFNHECKDHSLKTLSALPNVKVIDAPTEYQGITFMPYIHDLGILKAAILNVKTPVCVSHIDVMDFDYGNGQLCEKGLNLDDLKSVPLVISGHFHKHQSKANLLYIGSPFSHSFGESDQTKYLGCLRTTGMVELIETSLPKHTTLKLDLNDSFVQAMENFCNQNPQNFKRVELCGTQAQISSFPRESYSHANIKWVPRPIETSMNNVVIEEGLDNKQQFVKWAKDVKNLRPSTIELGLSIIGAVNAK